MRTIFLARRYFLAAASFAIVLFLTHPASAGPFAWQTAAPDSEGFSKEKLDALKVFYPDLVSYPQGKGLHKLAAGWLIDRAGWKGKNLGDAAVYDKQALVLVNRGGATGADIAALARAIQADIRTRYAVELEPEPVWV